MTDIDITEIDLYRIFKNPSFVIEHGGTPAAPPNQTKFTNKITNSTEGLKQIIAQGNVQITLLKALVNSLLPKEFTPYGLNGKTDPTPGTVTQLYQTSVKTSHFVIQNKGTANINVGDQSVQAISIAPGAMLFYSFTVANYFINLSSIYVSSPSASQAYSILVFR